MVNWVEIGLHVFDKLTESTTGRSACGGLACVGVAGRASPPPGLAREGWRPVSKHSYRQVLALTGCKACLEKVNKRDSHLAQNRRSMVDTGEVLEMHLLKGASRKRECDGNMIDNPPTSVREPRRSKRRDSDPVPQTSDPVGCGSCWQYSLGIYSLPHRDFYRTCTHEMATGSLYDHSAVSLTNPRSDLLVCILLSFPYYSDQ